MEFFKRNYCVHILSDQLDSFSTTARLTHQAFQLQRGPIRTLPTLLILQSLDRDVAFLIDVE
jgi:hypothetical protein